MVIAAARVPIQKPSLSVGVAVVEKLPRALTHSLDSARRPLDKMTGI
jgi:hypothetical protein